MNRARIAGVLLSFCALSMAVTAGPGAGPARAASLFYVEPAGLCAGLTPCFDTIQEGVENAGPAPAEVRVFPGTYAESVDLTTMGDAVGEPPGDLTVRAADAEGNPATGGVTVDGGTKSAMVTGLTFQGSLTIDGFTVHSSMRDGMRLVVQGDITIRNVTADGNGDGVDEDDTGDDGIDARSTQGNISISDSSGSDNGTPSGMYSDGFELKAPNGDVTLDRITAGGNQGSQDSDGVDMYEVGGTVTIMDSVASENSTNGFVLTAGGDVNIGDTVAEGNSGSGVDVYETGGTVAIEDSAATENEWFGFSVWATAGEVTVSNSTAVGNGDDGVGIWTGAAVTVAGLTSLSNGLVWDTGDGLEIGKLTGGSPSVEVRDSRFEGNKKHGVNLGPGSGTGHALTGSVFCNNEAGGLWLGEAVAVNATGNWWGDETGPAHPDNPGGSGQSISDGDSGAAGAAGFEPWIDTVTAAEMPAPASAVEGEPLAIGFQFSDGAGTVFLEEGPGDLNGAGAFTLSTDNGALTSSQGQGATVSEFIAGGRVTVTLTPDHEGTATVTLAGPCGLESEITVTVLPGGLHGDVDCDDDVDSVDSLKVLRHVAGLDVAQTEPCPDIGTGVPIFGDIDCDDDVDSVDSLRILRHVAGLPNNLGPGCGPVGT